MALIRFLGGYMVRRLKRIDFSRAFFQHEKLTPQVMMAMFEALPTDISILDWGHDAMNNMSFWIVESEQFEEIHYGQMIPQVLLKGTKDGGYIRFELVEE